MLGLSQYYLPTNLLRLGRPYAHRVLFFFACWVFLFGGTAFSHAISQGSMGLDIGENRARFIVSFYGHTLAGFDDDNDGQVSYEELNKHYDAAIKMINESFYPVFPGIEAEVAVENLMIMDGVPLLLKEYAYSVTPDKVRLTALQGDWVAVVKLGDKRQALFINDADRSPTVDFTQLGALVNSLILGVEHIIKGYDHLLFLLALLLVGSLRAWVKTVTAFTIAHTLTLYLGTQGIIKVPADIVEASIAASISLSALPLFIPRLREKSEKIWLLVGLIGLIHGLGFAGYLQEKIAGSDFLLTTLFGFNLGVELGQLAFVITVGALLLLLRRQTYGHTAILTLGCLIFLAGLGITLSRLSLIPISI